MRTTQPIADCRRLRPIKRRSGAAVLLAVWALLILSSAVLFWARIIQHGIAVSGQAFGDTEARAQAHSGIALALHPLVTKETPLLTDQAEADPGFRVRMISEGGKLNVNFLLQGEDPRKLDLLKKWLELRGLSFQERERLVDCVLDWMDSDNLKRMNGIEDEKNYHPPNRGQLLGIEELESIIGCEPLISQSGWKDDLTIFSQGAIDVTSANFDVLSLLPGLGPKGIERFLQWRAGADGVDGTQDDPPIEKLETVQLYLGVNKIQWNALAGIIMLRDNTWCIISEGHSGKVVRQVEVVTNKGGLNPRILSWKE